jgi:hypothetical protein
LTVWASRLLLEDDVAPSLHLPADNQVSLSVVATGLIVAVGFPPQT